MKKRYQIPKMKDVQLKHRAALLESSPFTYNGPLNFGPSLQPMEEEKV